MTAGWKMEDEQNAKEDGDVVEKERSEKQGEKKVVARVCVCVCVCIVYVFMYLYMQYIYVYHILTC